MRLGLGLVAVLLAAACGSTPIAPPSSAPATPCPSPTSAAPSPSASPSPCSSPTVSPPTFPSPPSPSPTSATAPPPASSSATPTVSPSALPLQGQDVRVIPTTRKVVALTFDGGSGDAGLASILATLAREDVRATFFLTGRFVTRYPQGAQSITAAGHVIGNHTMTHPHGTQISDAALAAEVREAEALLRATVGVSPVPWFRFPYGERTASDIRLLNSLGYVCVSWTVDSLGWLGTSRGDAADVTVRVLAQVRPGAIVLMHVGANPDDGTTYDAEALTATIHALRAQGYGFVTVTSLLAR